MSQQYSRWRDLQRQPGVATRSSRVEQVRLRIHEAVIDKLGSKLSDDDVDPDELLRLVTEQVHKALADRYASSDPGQPIATPDVPGEPRKRGWRR